jgi:long-chain acyl-CoA synthetase
VHHSNATNPFLYLAQTAKTNPSGVFVESVDQRLLNSEAHDLVRQIAYELRRLGVKPGELLALDLPEVLSMLFTQAAFHETAVSAVLPRGFVADGAFAIDWIFSSAVPAPASHGGARVVSVDSAFIKRVEQNPVGIEVRQYESEHSPARLVFSSGTTGQPNAILLPLDALEFHSANALKTFMSGDPFLMLLPTATTFGFFAFLLSVRFGRPFWSVEAGSPDKIVELAHRSSATSIKASPAQLAGVVDVLEARGQRMPSVQTIYVVGTVMPPALAARLRTATEGGEIYNLYGSTEATIATARFYESDDPFDAGHPFAVSRVQIVDENDVELPQGATGRIRHHHPYMVHEYVGNPHATAEVFKGDWFYPGDLGFIRSDGGLTLAGRASEVLNAGGVKIDPVQLDLFAVSHPGVIDAASFGYSSATGLTQIGIALVVADAIDVAELVRGFNARFGTAAPKLVARIDAIPRNAMGKPMRTSLAAQYAES